MTKVNSKRLIRGPVSLRVGFNIVWSVLYEHRREYNHFRLF